MSQLIRTTVSSRLLFPCAVLFAASVAVAPVHAQILYGSIVGTVTDAQGAHVPGATVTIVNKDTNLTRDTVSDSEGNYNLTNVLAGPYTMTVASSFYGEKKVSGEIVFQGEVDEHEILFETNGEIRGVVLDHDGVTPIAGATVDLRHPAFAVYDVHTDEQGAFRFPLVPPTGGSFPIDALYEHGSLFRQARVWVQLNRFGQELDVRIVTCTDAQARRLVLVENAKRRDLNEREKTDAYTNLAMDYDARGVSRRQLAEDDIGCRRFERYIP